MRREHNLNSTEFESTLNWTELDDDIIVELYSWIELVSQMMNFTIVIELNFDNI